MYVLKDQFQALRALQELAKRGPAVKVAVLDGNFDAENPSLSSQKIASASTNGKTLHGTAVASIVLGQDTGIAPQAEGLQIPVFEEDANGHLRGCSQLTLARAIRAACEAGASIINISGANMTNTGHPTDELREAVEHCENNNIAVVAAVGNDALSVDTVPANLHGVIAVGAHDIEGHPASFNNTGSRA